MYDGALRLWRELGRRLRRSERSGCVVVVDFADLSGLPSPIAHALHNYLRAFHVVPLDDATLAGAASIRFGPGRYYVIATFGSRAESTTLCSAP